MAPTSSDDLTGRARLRQAALRLFAEQGFAATSTRAVAAAAGVSPALVAHHFGSKDGLRAAVDDAVLDRLADDLGQLDDAADADLVASLGRVTADVFGADPVLRAYLRRVLLEGGPIGAAFFDRLLAGARHELDRLTGLHGARPGADLDWGPFQLLCLVLGPLLLEPVMQPGLDVPMFGPDVLTARSAANQDLVRHGLLAGPG